MKTETSQSMTLIKKDWVKIAKYTGIVSLGALATITLQYVNGWNFGVWTAIAVTSITAVCNIILYFVKQTKY